MRSKFHSLLDSQRAGYAMASEGDASIGMAVFSTSFVGAPTIFFGLLRFLSSVAVAAYRACVTRVVHRDVVGSGLDFINLFLRRSKFVYLVAWVMFLLCCVSLVLLSAGQHAVDSPQNRNTVGTAPAL